MTLQQFAYDRLRARGVDQDRAESLSEIFQEAFEESYAEVRAEMAEEAKR